VTKYVLELLQQSVLVYFNIC